MTEEADKGLRGLIDRYQLGDAKQQLPWPGSSLTAERGKKAILQWHQVNERIITARLNSNHAKMRLIQVYALTNQADEDTKDNFYEQLKAEISKAKAHDVLILTGDLNAKVGAKNEGIERNM